MRKIKTGIIGCGKIGHYHAKAYRNCKNSELVAAFNWKLPRAEEFAKQYGIKAFDNLEQMVKETDVEAVSICTPHPAHRELAVEAARLGLHIAIEKPLGITLGDCDAIINAAREAKVKGATIYQRRFYPSSMRVHEAIKDGKIGRTILGTASLYGYRDMEYYKSDPWRGTWKNEGGGVLVNQSPHQLDLLLWYMGEVSEVYGMWGTLNHPELEVEDTAVAVVRFKNGGLGTITVSNSQNPALYGNVHIHGENGATIGVQTDGGAMFIAGVSEIKEPPCNDVWTINGEGQNLEMWKQQDAELFNKPNASIEFFTRQLQDFLDAIENDREPLITLEEGRRSVELFTAIYRSQRDQKLIKFPLDASDDWNFDGRMQL